MILVVQLNRTRYHVLGLNLICMNFTITETKKLILMRMNLITIGEGSFEILNKILFWLLLIWNILFFIRVKNKRLRLIWKLSFWVGLIIILLGSSMLLFGYSIEEKSIFVGSINNIEIVDKDAIRFNEYLEAFKIIGLFAFTIGGIIVAVSLVMPSFVFYKQCIYKDDIYDSNCESPIMVIFIELSILIFN